MFCYHVYTAKVFANSFPHAKDRAQGHQTPQQSPGLWLRTLSWLPTDRVGGHDPLLLESECQLFLWKILNSKLQLMVLPSLFESMYVIMMNRLALCIEACHLNRSVS